MPKAIKNNDNYITRINEYDFATAFTAFATPAG